MLDGFFKGDVRSDPESGMQELLRALVMRANFVPAVRHALGWRGVRRTGVTADAWTARIKGYAGVFGLGFAGAFASRGWTSGSFPLFYFPDPGEPLVERCSIQAAAAVHENGYRERIGRFAEGPGFAGLFGIGRFALAVNADGSGLGLRLDSVDRLRSIALDGVRLPRGGELVEVVPAGGLDQDFPALEVALDVFEVLAASVAFDVEAAPAYWSERVFSGEEVRYDGRGNVRRVPTDDITRLVVDAGFGAAGDDLGAALDLDPAPAPLHRVAWSGKGGEPPRPERAWWRAHRLEGSAGVDKRFLGIDERPGLVVLTGYLGAGKTSFLQHFIEYQTQRNRFVAVIQNEIGEKGLDGKLVEENFTVVEMDEGCVCCSLAGHLDTAVARILSRFQPDTIVLETTGLANPANFLDELTTLTERVRLDAVTTVVDAANFETCLEVSTVAADQVRSADILLVNKIDLVNEDALESLEAALRRLNDRAPMVRCRRGDVPPDWLFGVELGPSRSANGTEPSARAIGGARPTHLAESIASHHIRLPAAMDRQRFLEVVHHEQLTGVFRMKGVMAFPDRPSSELFQYVGGRWEFSDAPPRSAEDGPFLVLIGRGLDAPALERLFGSLAADGQPSRRG